MDRGQILADIKANKNKVTVVREIVNTLAKNQVMHIFNDAELKEALFKTKLLKDIGKANPKELLTKIEDNKDPLAVKLVAIDKLINENNNDLKVELSKLLKENFGTEIIPFNGILNEIKLTNEDYSVIDKIKEEIDNKIEQGYKAIAFREVDIDIDNDTDVDWLSDERKLNNPIVIKDEKHSDIFNYKHPTKYNDIETYSQYDFYNLKSMKASIDDRSFFIEKDLGQFSKDSLTDVLNQVKDSKDLFYVLDKHTLIEKPEIKDGKNVIVSSKNDEQSHFNYAIQMFAKDKEVTKQLIEILANKPLKGSFYDAGEILDNLKKTDYYKENVDTDRTLQKFNKEVLLNEKGNELDNLKFDLSQRDSVDSKSEQHYNNLEREVEQLKKDLSEDKKIYPKQTLQEANANMEYLTKQIKFSGLDTTQDLKIAKDIIEKLQNNQSDKFSYSQKGNKANFGNQIEFKLNFSKADNGRWFFNSYLATLTNKKGEQMEQIFPIVKNGISATQATNLLEGRSTKIKIGRDDKEIDVFIKFNLKERTEKGSYKTDKFYPNYGIDTHSIVNKSKLQFSDEKQYNQTIKSLEKGNLTRVTFENGKSGIAVLNPQYKNLMLYTDSMERIKSESLSTKQSENRGVKM